MTKYLSVARKIHRFLAITTTTLLIIMAFTGSMLKYAFLSSIFSFIGLGMARYIHNQLSPWLAVSLLIMSVTGLYMYIVLRPRK
jgi:uncharacterized iron-regulated membrane protein